MFKKFNESVNNILTEMNMNSFYPAKFVDGSQAVGINCAGHEQIWMIGPTEHKGIVDYLTKEKLPKLATILWLPDKIAPGKGIAISIDSYEANKINRAEELASLGLIKDIDWENATIYTGEF
jgi:hypothetical protein